MNPALQNVLSRLRGVVKIRDGHMALCPAHNDRKPSLKVGESDDKKKILLYCYAGCNTREICSAIKLTMSDLYYKNHDGQHTVKTQKPSPPPTYIYHDAKGKEMFGVVRMAGKKFGQCRPDGNGGWIWGRGNIKTVPYHLPELLTAVKTGQRIHIAEGEKDVDNLHAMGWVATTNAGGAGKWKQRYNQYFHGSNVVVFVDHDEPGEKHAEQIARSLHEIAASIKLIHFNESPPKSDVSDFLAAGGTKEELEDRIATAAEWKPPGPENEIRENEQEPKSPEYLKWEKTATDAGFAFGLGSLCRIKYKPNGGEDLKPLANFIARPVKEITFDDGMETKKTYTIEGFHIPGQRPLPSIEVTGKEFFKMGMAWPGEHWGMDVNIQPGMGTKDHLRFAIQSMAEGMEYHTIYTHLGWRYIHKKWIYLYTGGAIGSRGVDVDPDEGGLHRYSLPDTVDDDAAQYGATLFDVGPSHIIIPLFAMVYLAPMCEAFRVAQREPTFLIWLVGQSGAMKSTLAALFLSHFGDFDRQTLPASFKDTGNALEKKTFLAKDTLLVVDDYYPTATGREKRQMEQKAQYLLRGYGDRVGRARMRADMTLRKGYVPRGMCIVTGEDTPTAGQSTTARFLGVELKKGDVDTGLLGMLQGHNRKLAMSMKLYITDLAEQMKSDNFSTDLSEKFLEYRQRAYVHDQHGRMPEIVAWLYIGFSHGLNHLHRYNAINSERKKELMATGWETLMWLAENHAASIREETPVQKFIGALRELLTTGRVRVNEKQQPAPLFADPASEFIGWRDDDWYYLLPGVTYGAVVKFYMQQNRSFPVSQQITWKALANEGYILTQQKKDKVRNVVLERVGGKPTRVLKLRSEII